MLSRVELHSNDHGIFGSPGDVSPWDIRFDPFDRAFLDIFDGCTARIRVHTEPGLESARCVVRRVHEVVSYPFIQVASTPRFRFWEAEIPNMLGAEFSLAFKGPEGLPVYLAPSGITNAIERLDRFTASGAASSVPEWVRGAVIYQIFPDRFARGASDPDDLAEWGSPPNHRDHQGGTLDGIRSRLDHIQQLGVDLIYLNPIFSSPSNHRYDTIDYYQVDPMLGGNPALFALVDEVHRRGMRIILDASFNHVHPRFFAFADLVERGAESEFRDWFIIKDWPLRIGYRQSADRDWVDYWHRQLGLPVVELTDPGPAMEPSYEAWYGVPPMPRVNLANPAARQYMIDVATYWVREAGIDGWRMDVVRYVDPDFFVDLRRAVREVRPDAYLLSEVMGDSSDWLQGDRFDATMNYTFRDIALRFFASSTIDGHQALDSLARLWALYGWDATLANQNLLDSHDVPRFLHQAGGDLASLRLATLLQMTFPGCPGVYYGNEIGLGGGGDPNNRAAFPWEVDPSDHPIFQAIASLAAVRRANPALVVGKWFPLGAGSHWFAFERRAENLSLVTIINRGRRSAPIKLPRTAKQIVWGAAAVDGDTVRVPARTGVVIRI